MFPAKFWVTSLVVILADQVTKALFTNPENSTINPGISFGFFSELRGSNLVLISVVILVLAIFLYTSRNLMSSHPIWMGLIVGGGVSNLLDRFIMGGVRDWMALPGLNLSNNLADWSIVVGIGAIIITTLLDVVTTSKRNKLLKNSES